ncbi:MAG TPA: hypothetical protein VHZ32_18710 [Rhizomicrobium sp.]|jgi:hypothetical protein|nr:hypothetical protein [Rhizomicrobium sp.]
MNRNKFLAAIAAAGLLLALPVVALAQDPHPTPAPLKPGKSAGVHGAQQAHTGLALIGGGAVIAVVIVAATAGNNGNGGQTNPQTQSVATTTTS